MTRVLLGSCFVGRRCCAALSVCKMVPEVTHDRRSFLQEPLESRLTNPLAGWKSVDGP